jgi:hypothetical protein
MKLISFDAMRTCGILDIAYVKPEHASLHIQKILQADWLLFPPYWQVNAFYYGLKNRFSPASALTTSAMIKWIGISTGSLINAYLRSVSFKDAGVRFKPKIESLAPGEMPALPSRQA